MLDWNHDKRIMTNHCKNISRKIRWYTPQKSSYHPSEKLCYDTTHKPSQNSSILIKHAVKQHISHHISLINQSHMIMLHCCQHLTQENNIIVHPEPWRGLAMLSSSWRGRLRLPRKLHSQKEIAHIFLQKLFQKHWVNWKMRNKVYDTMHLISYLASANNHAMKLQNVLQVTTGLTWRRRWRSSSSRPEPMLTKQCNRNGPTFFNAAEEWISHQEY